MKKSFFHVLSEDLRANTGGTGTIRGIAAFFYNPGFCAVALHRVAALLDRLKFGRPFGLLLWRLNVILNGCYLHSRAICGPGLRLPHPNGVVIASDVAIGPNVTLYQNVTIGVSGNSHALCPTIHAGCVVYTGAVIIGPISLGPNAIVGANSVVTTDVPEHCLAAGVPAVSKRARQASDTAANL